MRRVFLACAAALLALPACSAAGRSERREEALLAPVDSVLTPLFASPDADKITPSPVLAEAIANGEVSYAPAAAAYVPPVGNLDSSSDSESSSSFTAPIVTSPPVTASTPSVSGETAVDSFQSSNGVTTGKTNGGSAASSAIIVVGALVGAAAVVMAVMYKRKTVASTVEDEEQPQQQQQRTTTCTFENADFSPHRDSVDGMLQESRPTAESSDMLPIFSADRSDVGIARVSSPFGAKDARISSPSQRRDYSDCNIEFNVSSRTGTITKSSTEADL